LNCLEPYRTDLNDLYAHKTMLVSPCDTVLALRSAS
jgi:hypothetical protein